MTATQRVLSVSAASAFLRFETVKFPANHASRANMEADRPVERAMSDAPKSAFELAMEKLKKKDAEAGVEAQVLTDSQRAEIAEAKSVYDARVAERHIMHRSSTAKVFDPAELQERETELRRDLERFASDRDAKIKKIRSV